VEQQALEITLMLAPTSDTADQPYSVMRTGGTFDVTNTGGDNEPIIPRMPM
jgi:hypothetical protein